MHLITIFVIIIIVLFLLKNVLNNSSCSCCSDAIKSNQTEDNHEKFTPIRSRRNRKIAHPILPPHKRPFKNNKQVLALDFNEVFKNRLFECQTKCSDFKDRKCYKMINPAGNVAFACLSEDMVDKYQKCSKYSGNSIAISKCMTSDGTMFYNPPIFP